MSPIKKKIWTLFVRITKHQIETDILTCSSYIIFIHFVRPLQEETIVD